MEGSRPPEANVASRFGVTSCTGRRMFFRCAGGDAPENLPPALRAGLCMKWSVPSRRRPPSGSSQSSIRSSHLHFRPKHEKEVEHVGTCGARHEKISAILEVRLELFCKVSDMLVVTVEFARVELAHPVSREVCGSSEARFSMCWNAAP